MPPSTFPELVEIFLELINLAVLTLFGVLFLFFVWKMIDAWILHAGDETKREDGKKYAIAAVVVFVLLVTIFGIVTLLRTSFFG